MRLITAAIGRAHLSDRLAVIAANEAEARTALDGLRRRRIAEQISVADRWHLALRPMSSSCTLAPVRSTRAWARHSTTHRLFSGRPSIDAMLCLVLTLTV